MLSIRCFCCVALGALVPFLISAQAPGSSPEADFFVHHKHVSIQQGVERHFGSTVAMHDDVLVAADDEQSVEVLRRNADGTWDFEALIDPPAADIDFGARHAIATNGDWIAIGAGGDDTFGTNAGAVHMYKFDGLDWTYQGALSHMAPHGNIGYDNFGKAVSIEGDRMVVGSSAENGEGGKGAIHYFEYNAYLEMWLEAGFIPSAGTANGNVTRFAASLDISGEWMIAGEYGNNTAGNLAGAVHIYRFQSQCWHPHISFFGQEAGDRLGTDVSISGFRAVAGSPEADLNDLTQSGAVTLYEYLEYSGDEFFWTETFHFIPDAVQSYDRFGTAVDLDGDLLAVGAPTDDNNGQNAGLGYFLFDCSTADLECVAEGSACDAEPNDRFGYDVAVSNGLAAIGAERDDNIFEEAGSVYVLGADDMGFACDLTAPAAPMPDLLSGSDTGVSDSDNITQHNTPDFQSLFNGGNDVVAMMDQSLAVAGDALIWWRQGLEADSSIFILAQPDIEAEHQDINYFAPPFEDGEYTFCTRLIDTYGNASAVNCLTITIDNMAPVAMADDTTLYLDASGASALRAEEVDNVSTDNVGLDTLQLGQTSFACADLGANTVSFTATDLAGNTHQVDIEVSVVDTVSPVAMAQDLTVYLDASGAASTTAAAVDNGSSDACGVDTLTLDVTDFGCDDVGPNTVTLTATDGSGNSGTATAVVTVLDTISPMAVVSDTTLYLDADGEASLYPIELDGGSTDNCTPNLPQVGQMGTGGTIFFRDSVGTNDWEYFESAPEELTVNNYFLNWLLVVGFLELGPDDLSGLADLAGLPSVEPQAHPSLTFLHELAMQVDGRLASGAPSGAGDIEGLFWVGEPTFGEGNDPFLNEYYRELAEVELFVDSLFSMLCPENDCPLGYMEFNAFRQMADANWGGHDDWYLPSVDELIVEMEQEGGHTPCELHLTSSPFISLIPGNISIAVADADNCASLTAPTTSLVNFLAEELGDDTLDVLGLEIDTALVFDAYDDFFPWDARPGYAMHPTLFDLTNFIANLVGIIASPNPPTPADLMALNGPERKIQMVRSYRSLQAAAQTASDVRVDAPDALEFGCADVGANHVDVTFTDASGNTDMATAVVTVVDTISPMALAHDTTLYLDASGVASLMASEVDNGSSDACGIDTLTLDITSFTCADVAAPVTVTMTATDQNSNSAQATFSVTVLDTISPMALAHDTTLYLDASGAASLMASEVDNGSSDACGIDTLTLDITSFTCADVAAPVTVTMTATDDNNNSAQATLSVTVLDTMAPTLDELDGESLTVYLDENGMVPEDQFEDAADFEDACGVDSTWVDAGELDCSNLFEGAGEEAIIFVEDNHAGFVYYLPESGETAYVEWAGGDDVDNEIGDADILLYDDMLGGYLLSDGNIYPEYAVVNSVTFQLLDLLDSDFDFVEDNTAVPFVFRDGDYGLTGVEAVESFGNLHYGLEEGQVTYNSTGLGVHYPSDSIYPLQIAHFEALETLLDTTTASTDEELGDAITALGESLLDELNAYFPDSCALISFQFTSSTTLDAELIHHVPQAQEGIVWNYNALAIDTANAMAYFAGVPNYDAGAYWRAAANALSADLNVYDFEYDDSDLIFQMDMNTGVSTSLGWVYDDDVEALIFYEGRLIAGLDNGVVAELHPDAASMQDGLLILDMDTLAVNAEGDDLEASMIGMAPALFPVTFYAEDNNGNVGSAVRNLTLLDTISPDVIAQDLTVYLDDAGSASIEVNDADNGSSDNCSVDTLILDVSDFGCDDVGDNTVTLTATDLSGNVSSADFTVTVLDTISPMAVVSDTTLYLDANGEASLIPLELDGGSTDNCTPNLPTIGDMGFGGGPIFFRDSLGANGFEYFESAPEELTVNNYFLNWLLVVAFLEIGPDGLDDLAGFIGGGLPSVEPQAHPALSFLHSVALEVDERLASGAPEGGSEIEGLFWVGEPTFGEGNDADLNAYYADLAEVEYFVDSLFSQLCPVGDCPLGYMEFNAFQQMANANWGGHDDWYLPSVDELIMDMERLGGHEPCELHLTSSPFIAGIPGNISIAVADEDNCSELTDPTTNMVTFLANVLGDDTLDVLGLEIDTALVFNAYDEIFPWDARPGYTMHPTLFDLTNFIANLVAIISSPDAPTPDDLMALNGPERKMVMVRSYRSLEAQAQIPAAGRTASADMLQFTCSDVGANDVEVIFTDASGNTDMATAVVTVVDTISPNPAALSTYLYLDESGLANLDVTIVDLTGLDACGIDTLTVDKENFSCADLGEYTVELTVTDVNGNTTNSDGTVSVIDTITPDAVAMDVTVYLDASGEASVTATDIDGGSSDNCSLDTLTLDVSDFGCDEVGTNTVTLTVFDGSGNNNTATATVTVVDTISPVAMASDVTLYLDADGEATLSAVEVDNGSSDLCGIDTLTLDITSFSCADLEAPVMVTLTATDNHGNTGTATSMVTLVDTVSPIIGNLYLENFEKETPFDADDLCSTGNEYTPTDANWVLGPACAVPTNGTPKLVDVAGDTFLEYNQKYPTASEVWNSAAIDVTGMNGVTVSFDARSVGGLESYGPYLDDFALYAVLDGVEQATPIVAFSGHVDGTGNSPGNNNRLEEASFSEAVSTEGATALSLRIRVTISGSDGSESYQVDDMSVQYLPSDFTAGTIDPSMCGAVVSWTVPPAADNCSMTLTSTHEPGDTLDVGTTTVIYTATDDAGNTDQTSFVVTVIDTIAPTIVSSDTTLYLDASGLVTLTNEVAITDACGIATSSLDSSNFDCTNVGSPVVVGVTATDIHNNSATATINVTVLDTISPVATANPMLVYLDGNGEARVDSSGITIFHDDFESYSNNANISDVSDLWEAEPESRNKANVKNNHANDVHGGVKSLRLKTGRVNVALGNIATYGTPVSLEYYVSFGRPGQEPVAAQCDVSFIEENGAELFTYSLDGDEATTFASGDWTIEELATSQATQFDFEKVNVVFDFDLDTATVYFNDVAIAGASGPDVTNVSQIRIEGSEGGYVYFDDFEVKSGMPVSAEDACGIATVAISPDVFGCADLGEAPVMYTVTDVNNNVSTVNGTITVEDHLAPMTMAIADTTIYLDATGSASLTTADVDSSSADNCAIASLTLSQTSYACMDVTLSPLEVVLTGSDASGNSSTDTLLVTVLDTISPVALAHDTTLYLDASGAASLMAAEVDNGSTDACGIETLTLDIASFSCADLANPVTVTLTAADSSANSGSATSMVTVLDTISPVVTSITCPPAYPAFSDATCYADLSITAAGEATAEASDNCASGLTVDVTHSDGVPVPTCVGSYSFVRTWTAVATDGSGNTSAPVTCTQTITVTDNTAPTVTTEAADETYQRDGDEAQAFSDWLSAQADAVANDACSGVAWTHNSTGLSDGCGSTGTETVTFTATDSCGNSTTTTATFTVIDDHAPSCPLIDLVEASDSGSDQEDNITNDDTPTMRVMFTGSGVESAEAGDVVEFYINSTLSQTHTVTETDLANGYAEFETGPFADGAVNFSARHIDDCEQASIFAFLNVIIHSTNPTALASNATLYLDEDGNASISAEDVDDGSEDDFTAIDLSLDQTAFDCAHVGNNDVTFTATDIAGNTATAAVTITVVDDLAPAVLTNPFVLQLDANGAATLSVTDVDAGSTDNCGIASRTLNQTAFDCSHVGQNTVTLTVTDVHGNSATADVSVEVEDNVAPSMMTQDVTLELDVNGEVTLLVSDMDAGTSDACGVDVLSLSMDAFDCDMLGDHEVTLMATDVHGNSASASATVTIEDNIAPTINLYDLEDYTLYAGESCVNTVDLFAAGNPWYEAYDNCDVAVEILYEEINETGIAGCREFDRRWILEATDPAGNVSRDTTLQHITVIDTTAPVVFLDGVPADVTLDLAADCTGEMPAAAAVTASATDNCTDAPTVNPVTFVDSAPAYLCGDAGSYTVLRTYMGTATDACGNSGMATATQTVTFLDVTAPQITASAGIANGETVSETEGSNIFDFISVPDPITLTAEDACGGEVTIETTASVFGFLPTETIGNYCAPDTPEAFLDGDACNGEAPAAMVLEGAYFGGEAFFVAPNGVNLIESHYDQTVRIEVELTNADGTGGFLWNADYNAGLDWFEWEGLGRGYRKDCANVLPGTTPWTGWEYFVMQTGGMLGTGIYSGSQLSLTHQPMNYYYGLQVGLGANNVNANYGASAWFYWSGQLVVNGASQGLMGSSGDIMFDLDCQLPWGATYNYEVSDACGNSTDFGYTVEGSAEEEDNTPTVSGEGSGHQPFDISVVADIKEPIRVTGLMPNPTNDVSQLGFVVSNNMRLRVDLYTMDGSLVQELYDGNAMSDVQYLMTIDADGLDAGMYQIRIASNTYMAVKKLLVTQ